jgi:APA family basic amino acid/polyamine antiporter
MVAGISLGQRLARRKPIGNLVGDAAEHGGEHGELNRSITLFQLIMFGVGSTIGTGIFFVMAQTVPTAGPAVIVSFAIAGIVAGLTALCYAEMASMIPVSGSSYSYAYATLGEGVAFFVASCLILEYGISAAAVAVGWSGYLNKVFEIVFGSGLPAAMTNAPIVADGYSLSFGGPGYINLPAAVLVFLCCLLLMRGSKESAKANAIMVMTKMGVLALFVVIAITGFHASNLQPFAPFGWSGISAAAGTIFFTYVGLDAVSTAGEEVINPKRNLPIAIICALVIVTSLYILVAVTALGVQPAAQFDGQEAGLATILQNITGSNWPALVLAAGAVISVFSVTLVVLYGQTRILFAMSRDGMIPEIFHRVNPRTMTPVFNTLAVALFVGAIAAFVPDAVLWDLTSMGTLVAFMVVSAGVMILRRTKPDMPRGFKVPFYPVLPILSIVSCMYLIYNLNPTTFKLFGVWLVFAAILYLSYSARNSRLERPAEVRA